MSSRRIAGGLCAALFVAALAFLPVALAGATDQPTTLFDGHNGFRIHPSWVTPSVDGGVILGGRKRPGKPFGHIRWQRWGMATANGSGIEWVNDCNPDCAMGTYRNRGAIRLHSWRPIAHHFTRLTVNEPNSHQTLILGHDRYGWYWH